MTITLSTKKPSFWTMILSLTLFTAAGTVSGFTVGGNELTQTRILGRSSTKSYVSSVPLSVRNRSQMDGNTSSEGRWFSRPKQGEVQNSNQESLVVSADEHAVDDYLEFLDRRYRRLHEDGATTMLPKVTFSAWKWLAQEPVKDEATFQSEQEDALYVLGVAGLASKRLLQKHQTLTESSKPKRMTTKSADVRPKMPVMDVPIVVQAGKPLAIVNEFSQALARISDSRKSLHKFQNEKLKAAVAFCMRGPVKLCRSVWQWGGGKPTVTLTLSFTMALTFILVRLLSHVVASEGLNMTRA